MSSDLLTRTKLTSDEQRHLLCPGGYKLELRIDRQESSPSSGQVVRQSRKSYPSLRGGTADLTELERNFDVETQTKMDLVLMRKGPGDKSFKLESEQRGKSLKATSGDSFPLGLFDFQAGEYKLTVIGTICFKYTASGAAEVIDECKLSLMFYFDIRERKKQGSTDEPLYLEGEFI